MEKTYSNHAKFVNVLYFGAKQMSDFEKVFQEAYDYCIDDSCKHRYEASKIFAKEIWNHQQQKIDAVRKLCDAYWLDDDRDYNVYIKEIQELLK